MSRLGDLGHSLYRGEVSYDFVGRRKRWYLISAGILVVAVAALLIRGLHLGVDFNGGNVVTFPTQTGTVAQATAVAVRVGSKDPTVTEVSSPSGRQLKVQTEVLSREQTTALTVGLKNEFGVPTNEMSVRAISAD